MIFGATCGIDEGGMRRWTHFRMSTSDENQQAERFVEEWEALN
jgi:hypothetical protein